MAAEYLIPIEPITIEQKVKKSLFICQIAHTPDRSSAMTFVDSIKQKHPDANHNCWAFVAGSPTESANWAMNDDGEPKGCAAKPMFNVLQHSGIGEIGAVVSRYFGGIKLGTGGMARAYSSSVQLGLESLKTETKRHYHQYSFDIQYDLLQHVEHLLKEQQTIIVNKQFDQKVTIEVKILHGTEQEVADILQRISNGDIVLKL